MCHLSTISKPRLSKGLYAATGRGSQRNDQRLFEPAAECQNQSPSAQKLEALHRFLGTEFPRRQKSVGVVFGKFYPLHTGHIYLIQRACSGG